MTGGQEPSLDAGKVLLRRRQRACRSAVSPELRVQAGLELAQLVQGQWPDRALLAYASTGSEVDTWPLLRQTWARGQRLWLPLVSDQQLRWYGIDGEDQLRPGYHSILEPDPDIAEAGLPADPMLILVPGLAFTRDGGRLGQGGGFYDRALCGLRSEGRDILALGLAFACQVLPALPRGSHDQDVDMLVAFGEDGAQLALAD